jgi:hypothetical protein
MTLPGTHGGGRLVSRHGSGLVADALDRGDKCRIGRDCGGRTPDVCARSTREGARAVARCSAGAGRWAPHRDPARGVNRSRRRCSPRLHDRNRRTRLPARTPSRCHVRRRLPGRAVRLVVGAQAARMRAPAARSCRRAPQFRCACNYAGRKGRLPVRSDVDHARSAHDDVRDLAVADGAQHVLGGPRQLLELAGVDER